jgi:FkbM family methyltransferase
MPIADKIDALRNLGTMQTFHYAFQRLRDRHLPGDGIWARSKYAKHPLWCRHGTSDFDVFGQIFVHREYRCLDEVENADLIIDCGANCGFSSAYFLSRYDNARCISVEPDPENFRALQRNLAPYGSRITAHQAGIWSHRTGLVISSEPFGDGREWAVTVCEPRAGQLPMFEALDIPSLIPAGQRVSILKIDIEGSERQVFSVDSSWLDRVDNLVIELHGRECEEAFMRAIAGRGFELSRCDELTVCRRK